MIADVLGGPVTPNATGEIGWFDVSLTRPGRAHRLLAGLPERFEAFHWHGDRFEIPPGCDRLARSEACDNQAFAWGSTVLGLQFHLDYSHRSIELMVEHCGREIPSPGRSVQTPRELLAEPDRTRRTCELLFVVLDSLAASAQTPPPR